MTINQKKLRKQVFNLACFLMDRGVKLYRAEAIDQVAAEKHLPTAYVSKIYHGRSN